MDPLSQAVVGVVFSMSASKRATMRLAAFCGVVGGMAPDLDIIIRSNSDTLLALEYHRQFTHALISIPFVGLVVCLALWAIFSRKKADFKLYYIFTTVGVATHGLLDACTAYGTYLYWPFSFERVAWSNLSIIDPLFTIPLLVFVITATVLRSRKLSIFSVIYAFTYISFTFYNQNIVSAHVHKVAHDRGHKIERLFLNPTLGNSVLWRSIYRYNGRHYIDAIHSLPHYNIKLISGTDVPIIEGAFVYPEIGQDNQARNDILRFEKFTSKFLYVVEGAEYTLGDLRYSSTPDSTEPLWSFNINPNQLEAYGKFQHNRANRNSSLKKLKHMLFEIKLD
ncbi:MAG: inner membrane protein [Alphaproteobacteria bacterium]|jgi:inner membrane protein